MLSFGPIMSQAIGNIAGTSDVTNKAMTQDVLTDQGFLLGFNKAIYHTMAPGASLKKLTARAASTFLTLIDDLKNNSNEPRQISLFTWARSAVLHGTSDAVYGPQNPFQDPAIESAW